MTHADLDALDDFLDKKDEEPTTNGSLSVVVPMDDFKLMLSNISKIK